jgi:uncharacterized protein YxjI
VGLFKAANNYDIHDPETGEIVLECREPHLGFLTRMFRFSKYKRNTPFDIVISPPGGTPVVRITRGISLFLSKVSVFDEEGTPIGGFKQKLFSIGGRFDVLDNQDQPLCSLRGKWTGWEFTFATEEKEYARVTKKWAGAGKEFFTSADNYMLQVSEDVPADNPLRQLIMAAVMCIDMVLKE